MRYSLKITETAKREVDQLPGYVRQRVRRVIHSLAQEPHPKEAKELRGLPGRYRIRVERWRLIYRVDEAEVLVLVLRVRRKTGSGTYEKIE